MAEASDLLAKKFKENYRKNFSTISDWGRETGQGLTFKPEVEDAIKKAAADQKIDLDVLRAKAFLESSGRPDALGPGTPDKRAEGLFQFLPHIAKSYGLMGEGFDNRKDPYAAAQAAAELMNWNLDYLDKRNIDPTPQNAYLAHQQGGLNTQNLYNNNITPKLRRAMDRNLGKGATAEEFIQLWHDKMNMALDRVRPKSIPTPKHQLEPVIPESSAQAQARQAFMDNLQPFNEYVTTPINSMMGWGK